MKILATLNVMSCKSWSQPAQYRNTRSCYCVFKIKKVRAFKHVELLR